MSRARIDSTFALALVLACGCVRWGEDGDDSIAEGDEHVTTSVPVETGEETTTGPDEDEFVWPEQWSIDPEARLVVWGKTGLPTRNLDMFANVLESLAGAPGDGDGDGDPTGDGDGDGDGDGEPGGDMKILWIADCDPREDALGCLAGNVQPFFDMVATLGTIDLEPLSLVDPLAYDVVVADFCGPVGAAQVAEMLGDGARVLVLGDYWCESPAGSSAELANELLEHLGARFTGEVLYNHGFLVAEAKQVDLLEGITEVDAWGVALQDTIDPFTVALGTLDGALLCSRSE